MIRIDVDRHPGEPHEPGETMAVVGRFAEPKGYFEVVLPVWRRDGWALYGIRFGG